MARISKKLIEIAISKATVGFLIPMTSIPALYKALESSIAEGKGSPEELKAIVAAFPGVEAA